MKQWFSVHNLSLRHWYKLLLLVRTTLSIYYKYIPNKNYIFLPEYYVYYILCIIFLFLYEKSNWILYWIIIPMFWVQIKPAQNKSESTLIGTKLQTLVNVNSLFYWQEWIQSWTRLQANCNIKFAIKQEVKFEWFKLMEIIISDAEMHI